MNHPEVHEGDIIRCFVIDCAPKIVGTVASSADGLVLWSSQFSAWSACRGAVELGAPFPYPEKHWMFVEVIGHV